MYLCYSQTCIKHKWDDYERLVWEIFSNYYFLCKYLYQIEKENIQRFVIYSFLHL